MTCNNILSSKQYSVEFGRDEEILVVKIEFSNAYKTIKIKRTEVDSR